jgi:hypothetical protein
VAVRATVVSTVGMSSSGTLLTVNLLLLFCHLPLTYSTSVCYLVVDDYV